MKYLGFIFLALLLFAGMCRANESEGNVEVNSETAEADIGSFSEGSRTDSEVVGREEEAIKIDGLNVAQLKELREKAEKFTFQTEVNRMMKLIINSLYKNKEIFLRELISNASDALDKIRLLSLTDTEVLATNSDMNIKIKADLENKQLHIIDTGVGMTKQDLVNNLGTIAKSGTADFLSKMQESEKTSQEMNDMIGQFGVGFYSSFLVADRVTVTTKHNDDVQYIWESDANSYTIIEDPRGNTLKRGTQITLHLKDEALDFLQQDTIRNLVRKYSQFINFPIYMWASKTITVDEPVDEKEDKTKDNDIVDEDDDDAQVEDAAEDAPKTKKVEKTVWEWEIMNDSKPIWTRKPNEVTDEEYNQFYKSLTKDSQDPLCKVHFVAEGEVTFKSVLFVPKVQPSESFNKYGTKTDHIKLFVRRVFITDEFNDFMPKYLAFIQGIVDSDDLPLNVSRETLQQHKLIKIIKKKLVRKALDMLKKISDEDYEAFWKEYSTNIKLGVMEDPTNRSRLAKLLRFYSSESGDKMTFLQDYVSRMKQKQEYIYYIAGPSKAEVEKSPFVERLLKAGYEVLYLVEAVDEYTIAALPEYDGKKFQNVAKEIFTLEESEVQKTQMEEYKKIYEPLLKWLQEKALSNEIGKATVSKRLSKSPCALIASMFGWTGNMERLAMSNAHQKSEDAQRHHHMNQRKGLEINPRHPLIKELLRRVTGDPDDPKAIEMAKMMYKTATLRSGYMLTETAEFAETIENMMRQSLGIPLDATPDEDDFSHVNEEVPEREHQEPEEEEHDEL